MRIMQYVLAAAIAAAATLGVVWYGLNAPPPERPGETSAQSLPSAQRLIRRVEPEISFGPRPDFVEAIDIPASPDSQPEGPIRLLLDDVQNRAYADRIEHYQRLIIQPRTGEAATALRQFQIPLDPTLHKLKIHGLLRTRDGEATDLTSEIRHDFVSADSERSASVLTGGVVVLLRLPQSQPDDILELDFTIEESFPVAGWRPSLSLPVAAMAPFEQIHIRSIWPRNSLHYAMLGAGPEMTETQGHGLTTLSYGPAPFELEVPEPFTPAWRNPLPRLIASAFDNWNAVATWGESLFQPVPGAEVAQIADEIRAAHEDPDEQIMAALNYVQREIDYFAVMLGQGGYQPLLPTETLRYAEGDCKAKAVLLLSILQALDIDARAALVNSTAGRGLDDMPPTPHAFDHVIVTLMSGNRRYWLDPTRPEQGGSLWELTQEDWGHALILDRTSFNLVPVTPRPSRLPLVDVEDHYSLRSADRDDPHALLRFQWRFRGAPADVVREGTATRGEDVTKANLVNTYTARFTESELVGESELIDEGDDGVVISGVLNVTLMDFSTRNARRPAYLFVAHAANRDIMPVDLDGRTAPVLLGYPYDVRHRVIVTLPAGAESWAWPRLVDEPTQSELRLFGSILSTDVENDAFGISDTYSADGLTVSLTSRSRILSPELDPALFVRARNDLASVDPVAYFPVGERELLEMDRGEFLRLTTPTTRPDYRDGSAPY